MSTIRFRGAPAGRAIGGISLLVLAAFAFRPVSARAANPAPLIQGPDLSGVILKLEDLPTGFQPLSGSDLETMQSALGVWQGQIEQASQAALINVAGFKTADPLNPHFILSALVAPLSPVDQLAIDRQLQNPDEVIRLMGQSLSGGNEVTALEGAGDIGESRLAFSVNIGVDQSGSPTMRLDYVVARRGPALIEVAYMYRVPGQPLAGAASLARLLDERAIQVVGRPSENGFRPAGPLVPELTTYIPTLLDISTDPSVVGANLLLAALLMLPFAAAAEIFTKTLAEHEATLRRRVRPLDWLVRAQVKLEALTGSRPGRPGWQDAASLLGVIFFYGLVFSLLDRTWNPFTPKGLVLLVSMMIAYGVVGILGDIFQWRAIRAWGQQADLKVRPTNFLLAAFSTGVSRLFTLIPGMMFGTPEALVTDEAQFGEAKRARLLRIRAITLITVGLGVWLPTAITAFLQKGNLADGTRSVIGGVEAFLLVVFAVALENLFVQMLPMADSLGAALKKRSLWGWLGALTAVTFLFYHTLINPRGELAQAVREANVLVFFGIAVGFMVLAFGLQLYLRRREAPRQESMPGLKQAAPVSSGQPAIRGPEPAPDLEKPLILLPLNECKRCPVCGEMIRAEARLCRFCRATFTVSIKGYCPESHEVVDVNEQGLCVRCGAEPKDVHVESRLLQAPANLPARLTAMASTLPDTPNPAEAGSVKQCPACGQTIRAEALLCRFCHARFEVRERGYCLNEHAMVDVEDGNCLQCGQAAQDVHFESRLIDSPAAKAPIPAEQAAPSPKRSLSEEKPSPIPAASYKRPGCITAYAVLLVLGAALFAFTGLTGGEALAEISPTGPGVFTAIALGVAAINLVIAVGLWRQKSWARMIIFIVSGMGLVLGTLSIIGTIFAPSPDLPASLVGTYGSQKVLGIILNLIGLSINSTIFSWFRKNGKYFTSPPRRLSEPVGDSAAVPAAQPNTPAASPAQGNLHGELLKKIDVYSEAMCYLATCGVFDESKFSALDTILDKTGAAFGPVKRREMLDEAAFILPTRSSGGPEELHVQLQEALAQAFGTFNDLLVKVSPTPETAAEVQRIIEKYRIKA